MCEDINEIDIKVVSCTVKQLLSGTIEEPDINGQLKIPEYQRPYVWGKKQLNKLIADFEDFYKNYNNTLPLYYLGSIILHKEKDTLNIIDGQQRITTLALLDYFFNDIEHNIEYSSPKSINQIKENILYLKHKKIGLDKLNLELLNVTLVITNNEDDAYTFFETQNTGGKRLSGADIVKAHHLRAVKGNRAIINKAQQWESKKTTSINEVINLLTKARYWNSLNWKRHPSFRHKTALKNVIIENFTEKTITSEFPVSFFQSEIKENNFQSSIQNSSNLKAIRQPLYNGSHFIEYLSDYIDIYDNLFLYENDYRVDERFYEFRNILLTGYNGTTFLKELFQLVLLCYVSKFDIKNIYEFSLWAYRCVYSIRVVNKTTVREKSIQSFVEKQKILDKILGCFTHAEVISILKKYQYIFNNENCERKNVKGRYINGLGNYFPEFSNGIVINQFDEKLKKAINDKLKSI